MTDKETKSNIIPGIFLFTGEYGNGKTSAALGCGAKPERIFFIDADTKGLDTVKQLQDAGVEFGGYVNLNEIINSNNAYEEIWRLVDKITADDFDAVVIDPINPIYQEFRNYVKKNPNKFDTAKEWTKSRGSGFQFYEGKISRHARSEQERFLNEISRKVKTIQLTAHLKRKYDANVEVGMIPDVTAVINRIATCSVWLRRNPNHTTPILLFIKPLGEKRLKSNGSIMTVNITPRKAIPLEKELSVWDVIERYRAEPAFKREPTAEETPDADDRWIIEQTLTKEARLAWFARIRAKEQAEKDFEDTLGELTNPLTEVVKQIVESGTTAPPAIKVEILKKIETGDVEIDAKKVTIKNIASSM